MATTPVLGKRKRAQVSYAEPEMTDCDEVLEEHVLLSDEDEMTDDDTTLGSRKKLRSAARKKRARLTASESKKATPQKPFPFLSLPAELRDYIYELALCEPEGIALVSSFKAYRRTVIRGEINTSASSYRDGCYTNGQQTMPARNNSLSPNLLAVNKQIHAEGLAWLYQQPFYLADTMTLHTFAAAIGPANRGILTNLSIEGWGSGRGTNKAMNFASLTALADCTNLKTLRLDCEIPSWNRKPRDLARQLYRDGHFFFERFGAANGRKDAGVDVLEMCGSNYEMMGGFDWNLGVAERGVEETKKAFRKELRKLLGC